MLTKFVLAFGMLALAAGFAGSVPAKAPTYKVTLFEAATVNGTTLKAGDYKVTVAPDKVTFTMGKESREIPAKIENADRRYEDNFVQYDRSGKQVTIKEICLGGAKTKLVFN